MSEGRDLSYSRNYLKLGITQVDFDSIFTYQNIDQLIDRFSLDKTTIEDDFSKKFLGTDNIAQLIEVAKLKFFQIEALRKVVDNKFKKLSLIHHPDKGGDGRIFQDFNNIKDEIKKNLDSAAIDLAQQTKISSQKNNEPKKNNSKVSEPSFESPKSFKNSTQNQSKDFPNLFEGTKFKELLKKQYQESRKEFDAAMNELLRDEQIRVQEKKKREDKAKKEDELRKFQFEKNEFKLKRDVDNRLFLSVFEFLDNVNSSQPKSYEIALSKSCEEADKFIRKQKSVFSRVANFFGIGSEASYKKNIDRIRDYVARNEESFFAIRDRALDCFNASSQEGNTVILNKISDYLSTNRQNERHFKVSDRNLNAAEDILANFLKNGLRLREKYNSFNQRLNEIIDKSIAETFPKALQSKASLETEFHVKFLDRKTGAEISIIHPQKIISFSYRDEKGLVKQSFLGESSIWSGLCGDIFLQKKEFLGKEKLKKMTEIIESGTLELVGARFNKKDLFRDFKAGQIDFLDSSVKTNSARKFDRPSPERKSFKISDFDEREVGFEEVKIDFSFDDNLPSSSPQPTSKNKGKLKSSRIGPEIY